MPNIDSYKLIAGGVFLAVVLVEALWLWRRSGRGYPWREMLATLAMVLPRQVIQIATAGIYVGAASLAYEHRVMTFEVTGPLTAGVAFLAFEFFYYWNHRWMHTVRWLWATHAVHHTPNHMNFSVALRLGWTNLISGTFFIYLPLALLGLHPVMLLTMLAVNLLYQFWLHTEIIGKLGVLEWVLNTPSHHRVHHASNPAYLDKNYGGVVIFYDRLFGSFARERDEDPVRYGLITPLRSLNPFVIALHEWVAMGRDVCRARSVGAVLRAMVGRPSDRKVPRSIG